MHPKILLILIFAALACKKNTTTAIAEQMEVFKEYERPQSCKAYVYFFLQPDCPLSQNHTKTLADLATDERFKDFCFTAFFSGSLYERNEYEYFILHYPTPYSIRLDPKLEMARSLGATVVPEVFVLGENEEMLYQGAINDWAVREGAKRQSPDQHYLLNALIAIADDRKPEVAKTVAVGCILE